MYFYVIRLTFGVKYVTLIRIKNTLMGEKA